MESDTPRTELAIEDSIMVNKNLPHTDWVPAYLARELERENVRLRDDLSKVVCAILKRDGKDVTNMTAMDRLAELHANEALCMANNRSLP